MDVGLDAVALVELRPGDEAVDRQRRSASRHRRRHSTQVMEQSPLPCSRLHMTALEDHSGLPEVLRRILPVLHSHDREYPGDVSLWLLVRELFGLHRSFLIPHRIRTKIGQLRVDRLLRPRMIPHRVRRVQRLGDHGAPQTPVPDLLSVALRIRHLLEVADRLLVFVNAELHHRECNAGPGAERLFAKCPVDCGRHARRVVLRPLGLLTCTRLMILFSATVELAERREHGPRRCRDGPRFLHRFACPSGPEACSASEEVHLG